jgi:hypothetical protein
VFGGLAKPKFANTLQLFQQAGVLAGAPPFFPKEKLVIGHAVLLAGGARLLIVSRRGTMNKVALFQVAVLVSLTIVSSIAKANDFDTYNYIHPHLAADGVTSDDVALARAAEFCDSVGTRLVLPAGKILLTGAATIRLNHCSMVGVEPPPETIPKPMAR